MSATAFIYQVAVPTPLQRTFDYLAAPDMATLTPGTRVRVSFGKREIVGVIMGQSARSELPLHRLKRVGRALDAQPLLAPSLLNLLVWASDYYHYPIGEVIHTALPARLRQGGAAVTVGIKVWTLTSKGQVVDREALKRASAR